MKDFLLIYWPQTRSFKGCRDFTVYCNAMTANCDISLEQGDFFRQCSFHRLKFFGISYLKLFGQTAIISWQSSSSTARMQKSRCTWNLSHAVQANLHLGSLCLGEEASGTLFIFHSTTTFADNTNTWTGAQGRSHWWWKLCKSHSCSMSFGWL